MEVEEESERLHSPRKTSTLHAHRLDHNPSKLPAYRFVDLNRISSGVSSFLTPSERASASLATTQGTTSSRGNDFDLPTAATPLAPYSPARRPSSSPAGSTVGTYLLTPLQQQTPSWSSRLQDRRTRRAPAYYSSNGIANITGPPPALSTQRSSAAETPRTPTTSTTEWALAQQQLAYQTLTTTTDAVRNTEVPRTPRGASKSLDESSSSRPLIPPIRSFRSSATRASLEMQAKAMYRYEPQADDQVDDRDRTLRALEGFSDRERNTNQAHAMEQDDHTHAASATEDVFLNIARDDQDNNESLTRSERRRSRIALASNRQSLTYASNSHQQSPATPMSRRGSDVQAPPVAISGEDHPRSQHTDRAPYHSYVRTGSALSHRYPPLSRSHPSTPRGETQYLNGGRRSSIPDSNASISSRSHTYRQSNLSYSTPRIYNSSPLVARQREVDDGFDTQRVLEGTESTVSTTAPSTVWDELDDLKSRIRKLELTGKLPPTSGAAISRASVERPPTATTTITTMSTSPKRGRGSSTSPVESNVGGQSIGDAHPLLHSALAKSKSLVHPEVYKALEATSSDALGIAMVAGSLGQTGPISSAQSVIGSGASTVVTDRQLRRKADGLCRSLTELCIALSEARPEITQPQHQEATSQALIRPMSRDGEGVHGGLDDPQRNGDGLPRLKPTSRVPSRLEARRSSMLATSSLPTPRHTLSEAPSPAPSTIATRRTSALLRSRRAGTETPEEDESRFRAPSRAVTEIIRTTRNSPREYTSQQPLPEIRAPSIQSSLPLRRNYVPTNLTSNNQDKLLPNPALTNRRYLDRSTPERDTTTNNLNHNNNPINRLGDDRGHRGHGTVSALAYEGSGLGTTRTKSLTKSLPRPQLRERIDTEASID